eukprot:TRINITY_DN22129_c0_g2_i1.p1 TRINITY_DN22129_c0_g2~~TRINITY_DN22129_c0_g2_i1.p1  ORF type:complete len:427 (-),score=95.28 TRINITY_DN22129_c0_g2_i1:58-1338(-)
MATAILLEDLEAYAAQYGEHGAIQRLQFIAVTTDQRPLKIEAYKLCLDLLKRTTNTKTYFEVHAALKEVMEAEDSQAVPPHYDSVWAEATAKQAAILKEVYEQEVHQAKVTQIKDTIRTCYVQLATFCSEQGDYMGALRSASKSREFCSEPRAVFTTCMSIIKLNVLLRQYADIQSFANKAQHSPFKEFASDQSKISASHGLYYMTSGKYKEAALAFVQVKPQDLACTATFNFTDVLCAQDVAVYGVLCALASLERSEVQTRLLGCSSFCECLDLVPQLRELTNDFCSCRYAQCLATLHGLRNALDLDVHLSDHVADILQQIRSRSMVQYFAPFLSVSLHSMAEAFNTDVDGIQAEVAQLVGKRQLDAKIDSHRKLLHVRHSNQRKAAYHNAMRVSEDFLDTTRALVLRMNLLKRDFGVHLVRQKK